MKKNQKESLWIVTEGLIGTENQCLGIASALGVTPKVLRIKLNQPWKALSPYIGFECSATFNIEFAPPWPDLLLVSGRKAIAAARYIKKQSGGKTKTIFIQNPRIHPKNFDIVIAPRHDGVQGDNVFTTIAAPNKITASALENALTDFPQFLEKAAPRLAVLIGGKSKSHILTASRTQDICKQLLKLDASLMLTTSRRTGAENTKLINQAFAGTDHFLWDGQGANPYMAMLAASDAILVTNDSASMLSEAATTGKPLYIMPIDGHNKRVQQLQDYLIETGRARLFSGSIESWAYEPLQDAQKAADYIREKLYNAIL